MPNILAIETSSELASVALLFNQTLIQQQTHGVIHHSQSILPMVQSLLSEAGITLSQCDAIAFGAGPGSFTGVRTACGVVQGMAFGASLPVIPVVTLLALAQACRNMTGAVQVLAVLDARMGEVYWAQYYYDGVQQRWQTRIAPALSTPALLTAQITDGLQLIGNVFTTYSGQFNLPSSALESAQYAVPQAQDIARLAEMEFAAGRYYSAEQAQPLYLRNKIALTTAERAQRQNVSQ